MRIQPLVTHACLRLPALSGLFSTALGVTSIDVVSGGTTTITTSAAHGVTIGQQIGVTIIDAETPNPITGVTVVDDDEIRFTTQFAHDLTTRRADQQYYSPWHTSAKLANFGDANLDGVRQLLERPATDDRNTFSIVPGAAFVSITLEGDEVLLEVLERELIGFKKVTAATTTTLTFATPAAVTRSYTVTSPTVVRNHRIFGAASREDILQFMADDSPLQSELSMWIVPTDVRTSRSRVSKTDALAEISEGTDYRQFLIDGFEVIVVIPRTKVAGIGAADLCQGQIFQAVLKTFRGLKVPQPEFCERGNYVATFEAHQALSSPDRARHYHSYRFEVPAYLIAEDAIAPYDIADLDTDDPSIIPDSLPPVGAPAATDVEIDIYQDGEPSEMTGSFRLDVEDAAS